MIRADRLFTGIGELATLASGPVPRCGAAMGELGLVPDAAVAVADGTIVAVGPERALRRTVRLRPRGTHHDLEGSCVMPGFVDAHTHLVFAGDRHGEVAAKLAGRSYGAIARNGGGLFATVRATREAPDAVLVADAVARLGRMARSGTTTAEVKGGYALTVAGELRLLGLIPEIARRSGVDLIPTYLAAHAVPPEYRGRSSAWVREILRGLPLAADRHRARFCDVFVDPGFFSVAQAEQILTAARQAGLGLKIHADEFTACGGAELAARLQATSADHLLEAPPSSYAGLQRAGTVAVLLPVTPFASLSGSASPGRALVDAGVPVALGTDLSPNSWVEAMPIVLAHAVYSARLTPAEALSAATVNAAHAVGASAEAGQIRPGRPANFSVFPVRHAVEIPYRIGLPPTAVYRRGTRLAPT
ncbi:MAG: imidazolonepropionase [Thermoplasmata archaeon]